jgi:hypothetical protein
MLAARELLMSGNRQKEIDANYDFFRRNLSRFLKDHRGQFALLRSGKVVEFFDGPGEAYRSGLARFPDELFSIQEVEDRPEEMGLMSLAIN